MAASSLNTSFFSNLVWPGGDQKKNFERGSFSGDLVEKNSFSDFLKGMVVGMASSRSSESWIDSRLWMTSVLTSLDMMRS